MNGSKIILESSLQVFFYDLLQTYNRKMTKPLSNETIFYSSLVMDRLGESEKFFEIVDGKIREKVLGIKLLESSHLSRDKMKTSLRDIAETSLLVCGFFSDSLNKKIIDLKYYQDLGVIAYSRLNSLEPQAYNVHSFYSRVSDSFADITTVMSLAAVESGGDKDTPWLIFNKAS